MAVRAWFKLAQEQDKLICSVQPGQRKLLKRNGKEYDRLSEHIGVYPVVLIAPNDTDVIREGSEVRRKFFDGVLSQLDREYLQTLIQYNHALKQRNSLLKQFGERKVKPDYELLEPFTEQLLKLGVVIYTRRQALLNDFMPRFQHHYHNLTDGLEEVTIKYRSTLDVEDARQAMQEAIPKDVILQRSTVGPHRDEYQFRLEGHQLKRYGSQGQQKSFLIALKLAQFDLLREAKGFKPILLLDDIFDKLDDFRMARLMELVSGHTFGQIFVTDARPERSVSIFKRLQDADVRFFSVESGRVEEAKASELSVSK
jgi:DNA replication and repair protein RecF